MNKGLIVSCQALKDEPLHSSFIMSKMALAAKMAGAVGIRANGVRDILEIKKEVDLPLIGIIKKEYKNKKAYITPTMKEVAALIETEIDTIAIDATIDQDEEFLKEVLNKYTKQKFMADISTIDEGLRAEDLGFDYISTTLVGYTEQSLNENKFYILKKLIERAKLPIIAEGNFDTPEKARKAMKMGAYAVVVGSAITRPQIIAKKFVDNLN
ncbi:N-acetylmannosamine-6-phosphate 2-epimerase [Halocella sp. SP3-1]|uniref:N-acetylmannosamine-6-phosphate 2-epimerase n=1 Tax=Halocella sp. SP3-1 TaxID=2382161 RepID=UPI000F75AB05|nr:N-acetylmannosamine-6-phosphate 2-epimerase [Halocella sp. SP3-1]AZO93746.1 N-acetylmannosamine-6-phosphate 2-epimerase [Halocella sp. SP3-1]